MRRGGAAALAAIGLVLAACGAYGDGGSAKVEQSLAASMRAALDRDAPLVAVRDVTCDAAQPLSACRVDLGVGNEVAQVGYLVTVQQDGCWTANAVRVEVIGSSSGTTPLAHVPDAADLRGCIR